MAVNLHTTHYRFGINELAETTHGWHAAEDANPAQGVIAVATTFLLRFTVQETGGTIASNTDQQFRVAKNGGAFQDITTTSTIVKAVTTAVFANGADLSKRLSGTGTFESSGDGGTHDGVSGGAQNDIAASGNSETECALQIVAADVVHGDVLTFALTSPDFTITNDVVPTLTVSETTTAEADGASTGSAVALAVGAALWLAIAAAAGVGTALGEGQDIGAPTIIEADGSSDGVSVATGVSGATAGSIGASDGLASAQSIGAAFWNATAEAAGVATPLGVSGSLAQSVGESDGLSTVAGQGENTAAPTTLPIGTVPVRYLLVETANVVPVLTVLVFEIGVVTVREFVGPANVVPVREVTTETPHVKVLKV